ncbi:hypothetical protein T440DRAFT_264027 [Plenodomus tracheiphilus IPT5]|uniref:5'-3' DNA helicase ZGRF1-like N-terminal domain-containing protein n=1 Tax=Plenodomus tracheiphilus IPT5 TaxID=1408161 RepID=A0A6A7ATW1_9PLEO|nr:hypothetical protein T440DRAFT_264027 [Plenodomus tracheiphilus IPT5]
MTAPMRGTPHGTALSASQTTAPVAEFRCLFTHDVRRKQKRWQDGFLKFHTFNNRVMVYDETRNFLGDTYYKDSNELHEGDLLNLDKGVMIEVAEAMGVTQTDLTPLFEKKTKEPPRSAGTSQSRPFQRPTIAAPSNAQQNASQLRHKSLNTLLGTSKGPIGKAQPMQSPFETRKEREKENNISAQRASKRQKTAHPPSPWRASSPAQEEIPIAKQASQCPPKPSGPKTTRKPPSFVPPSAIVIDVEAELDPFPTIFSDVTPPDTPPRKIKARKELVPTQKSVPKSRAVDEPVIIRQMPTVHTPKIPRGKVPVPSVKFLETPKQPAPRSSPPVSASNRLANVESSIQPLDQAIDTPAAPPPPSPPRNPKAKSLRLSAGVKRGTLICQGLPTLASRKYGEQRTSGPIHTTRQASRGISREPPTNVSDESKSHSRKSTGRSRDHLVPQNTKRRKLEASRDKAAKRAKPSPSPPPPEASLNIFDDPELVHGMMDEPLLVPSLPVSPSDNHDETVSRSTKDKATAVFEVARVKKFTQEYDVLGDAPVSGRTSELPPVVEEHRNTELRQSFTKKCKAASNPTAPRPLLEALNFISRAVSPTHTNTSFTRSRTSSISPKKPVLSTGGFNKKPKRISIQPPTDMPAPSLPLPLERRNETMALPPHPLRAAPKGPLMSTTELAALLQTSTKPKSSTKDPIEDVSIVPNTLDKSPNRSFRRVRSENDAPIPSAAEDWEKRNLPLSKTSSTLTEVTDPGMETGQTLGPNTPVVVKEAVQKKATTFVKGKGNGLSALIQKTDPRRKFKRTQSLVVQTNVQSAEAAGVDLPSPVIDEDVGPWSTEAGDLFDWRPPGR